MVELKRKGNFQKDFLFLDAVKGCFKMHFGVRTFFPSLPDQTNCTRLVSPSKTVKCNLEFWVTEVLKSASVDTQSISIYIYSILHKSKIPKPCDCVLMLICLVGSVSSVICLRKKREKRTDTVGFLRVKSAKEVRGDLFCMCRLF